MKIYTKTGDSGDTGLFGGPRVRKNAPRIEAYGAVDELNGVLGLARAHGLHPEIDALVRQIQNELFELGAQLATPDPTAHGTAMIGKRHIDRLESTIDRYEDQLPALKQFVLPGGSLGGAALHLARTVCRRAERRVIALMDDSREPVAGDLVVYLNRLSDLLFVVARWINHQAGVGDDPWQKP